MKVWCCDCGLELVERIVYTIRHTAIPTHGLQVFVCVYTCIDIDLSPSPVSLLEFVRTSPGTQQKNGLNLKTFASNLHKSTQKYEPQGQLCRDYFFNKI